MAPFFLFILLIPLHLQANSQDLTSERTILLSMKQHWGNPSSLESWNSTSPLCDWPQVTCTFGAVTALKLAQSNISGTIPSTICQLKNLVEINLSQNNLSGHLPVSLRNCSKLERLDLSLNALTGSIPGEFLLMKRLRHLSLNGNRLVGEIPSPIEPAGLEYLNLSNNHLNGSIPNDIRHLHKLTQLDLSHNQLSGDIIKNVFHLRSMSVLRVCSNFFMGKIPYEFVNQRFHKNCLDFSNLCSDNRTENLPSCPSRLCSDHRNQEFLRCHSPHDMSERLFLILTLITVGNGIVGFAVLYYLIRKCCLKKDDTTAARGKKIWPSDPKEDQEWEMISIQRLKFNKTDILSGLTDENLIGNGGSGKVYRVFINQTGNYVAVKSISNPRKSDRRLEKEFLAEIKTLGTIRHNNIVKLLCYISGNNLKLLVYQYFENKSLDQWLHSSKREISSIGTNSATMLDWPTRMSVAIGAAQGLCYMHHDCSPPIIHRDIKSRNILLDSEFNAKIADFGLSKLLTRQGDTETTSTITGTFGYIAPEYAYTSQVNTKTDVYSFGVVLLELTTRREAVTPGDHMNLAERAQLLYRDTNAIIGALDDEIKGSIYLDQIITVFRLGVICTATSPSNRPSMKDCLHILQNCRNGPSSSRQLISKLSDYQS